MDNNFLFQKNAKAQQKYQRKLFIVITVVIVLATLILGGLIKVIGDEKKIKDSTGNVTINSPSVTTGAESLETNTDPANGAESTGSGQNDTAGASGTTGETSGTAGGASDEVTAPPEPTAPAATSTPAATPTPTPIPVPKVIVDPGHGGEDLGSVKGGLEEKDANLAIALYLEDILVGMGYEVYMIRTDDSEVENRTRPELASEQGGDIYVSIHQNSLDQDSDATRGCEVWYSDLRDDGSAVLSQYVVDAVAEATGTRNRGIKLSNKLIVLKYTEMPACLVECGFMSSETERTNIFTPEYQQKIAQGIADGIVKFLPIEQ